MSNTIKNIKIIGTKCYYTIWYTSNQSKKGSISFRIGRQDVVLADDATTSLTFAQLQYLKQNIRLLN